MRKYEPLRAFLASQDSKVAEVKLTFSAIETIIRAPLPASARLHSEWWSNEARPKHGQKLAWRDAGWRTEKVLLHRGEVVFQRTHDA
jgi:hypothetical protein